MIATDMAESNATIGEMGLTRGLAAFAASAGACPETVRHAARRAVIDTVGVILAGRGEAAVRALAATLDSDGPCRSIALDRDLSAGDAALVDGLAGHVLDYDDVARHGHPSVVIVPALWAEARRTGASGGALLDALAVGYEAWGELAWREGDAYHLGAWHPTSTLGIVSATAALCALHRLDVPTGVAALSLAASFAGGVIASFGSAAKPLQAGRAAAGAVMAVRLAMAGLGGSADALEGAHGLLRGLSPQGSVELTAPVRLRAGRWSWVDEGLSVKRYPVCYAAHRAIDAVLDLAGRHGLKAGEVRAIVARIGPAPAATLRYAQPVTGAEARFSMQHNLAAALVDGAVGFAQLTDDFVRRADVAALYGLTRVEVIAGDDADQPGMAAADFVRIETRDGRVLDSGSVRHPRGSARLPLSDAELDAKFRDCARHGGVDPEPWLARLHGMGAA
ncbi:MAG: MmgE/PrpD family protein [Sphingomonadales bacterium]|nr:MmgE/PrpD family protein [Sphingomonadales bacterium]